MSLSELATSPREEKRKKKKTKQKFRHTEEEVGVYYIAPHSKSTIQISQSG